MTHGMALQGIIMPKKPSNKTLKAKAWKLFSEYIRRKYADKDGIAECYTCGKRAHWKGEGIQCGHAIGGRGNYVLFLEEICRPQCNMPCNTKLAKAGNYEVFIPKIIKEIGVDEYEHHVRESRKPFKRTRGDYEDLISYYSMRLEALQGGHSDDKGESKG